MSELKSYNIMDIEAMDDERLEKSESGKIQVTRVYIKSEADEVIAEKDKEIEELKSDISDLRDDKKLTDAILDERNAEIEKLDDCIRDYSEKTKTLVIANLDMQRRERRYKYKHCLNIADKCVVLCYKSKDLYRWAEDENLQHHYNHKIEFFSRWHNRWLELAKKFKEAK